VADLVDLFLEVGHLGFAHGFLELTLKLAGHAAELGGLLADGAQDRGQFLRTDHYERDHADEDYLIPIEHRVSSSDGSPSLRLGDLPLPACVVHGSPQARCEVRRDRQQRIGALETKPGSIMVPSSGNGGATGGKRRQPTRDPPRMVLLAVDCRLFRHVCHAAQIDWSPAKTCRVAVRSPRSKLLPEHRMLISRLGAKAGWQSYSLLDRRHYAIASAAAATQTTSASHRTQSKCLAKNI
jgi:hypothetical protein